MTSKSKGNAPYTSCYIYVDQGESPILAGRYKIKDGVGYFTYGQTYAARPVAFSFDPLNLLLTDPLRTMTPKDGKDKFGVLSDATPDNWGRKLIQSLHCKAPRNEIEWLLAARGSGVGCLSANLSSNLLKHADQVVSFDELSHFIRLAVKPRPSGRGYKAAIR